MKNIIYVIFPLLAFASSIELPELPWDKLGIGVIGGSGYNATFTKNSYLYGLNVLSFNIDSEFSDQECDLIGWDYEENCNDVTMESSLSALVFMPRFGKQFNLRTVDKLQTYYKGEIYMVLPIISIDIGDESTTEFENDIEDLADMLGFNIAYGIEYKFNNQLSFSTDIGFNYLWNNIDIEGTELSAKIGHSYTLLSLNYSMN